MGSRATQVSAFAAACLMTFLSLLTGSLSAQTFACPAGQIDVMKYFAMGQQKRPNQFMTGNSNPIYTQVYPNQDFAASGYWFWLKSSSAHGFDVKAFDKNFVYMRSTELNWLDNSTFKRFAHDLPIAYRCISAGKPGPQVKVSSTTFNFYSSCSAYASSNLGTSVNDLDAPLLMDAGGSLGRVWTRVLHYHYDCDKNYQHCADEERFYLANGYGLWQWKHLKNGVLKKSVVMNNMKQGVASQMLPCRNSYQ